MKIKVMYDVIGSLVLYNTPAEQVDRVSSCFFSTRLKVHLYLVDNGALGIPVKVSNREETTYLALGKNVGYGRAHNIAIRKSIKDARYHVVLNPDIYFDSGTIERVYNYMEDNWDIAHVMPKIVYPNGEMQFLCKLLPTPIDLLFRRFIPNNTIRARINKRFELRDFDYTRAIDVPYLSGCFMFFRTEALEVVGMFDERFFMYPEDIDLTRRLNKQYRTVFFPHATVVHMHAKESYKSFKMLFIHVINIIKYFNKWGWFFDRARRETNKKTIVQLKQ